MSESLNLVYLRTMSSCIVACDWGSVLYSSLSLSRSLSKLVSLFYQDLCSLQASNMVYIWRMSDCIVGLRLRLIARIFPFFLDFFLSVFCMFNLKNCVTVFSGAIQARYFVFGILINNMHVFCIIGLTNKILFPVFFLFIF